MEPGFWLERWRQGRIGFHQPRINTALREHWPQLALSAKTRVLVPLCGKSLDLLWLAERGHAVLGVELAEEAAHSFFAEHDLEAERQQTADGVLYRSGPIEILCGDIFQAAPALWADCGAVFDRAALIALPPAMRPAYCRQVYGGLAPGYRGLLLTLDYPQELKAGPPFSVPHDEVRTLLANLATPELLRRHNALEAEGKFASQGVKRLDELTYRLTDARRVDPKAGAFGV
ncbi:MAG: thiopurine S-methyltransferase [Pigmentiphaga sp.]|nr:thiopurine S-methyltransferase [Pigmentiphaga sp.]